MLTPPDPPLPPSQAQEAESPKPDLSYDYLEEMETCEDRGCPGPPKSLSSKAGPATTKGQEGDGPERAEPPLAPAAAAPGTPGPQRNDEMELEKMRMEFELERLWYLQEENERQRQHEEVMEQLRQQARPRLVGDRSQVGGEGGGETRGEGSPSLTCTGTGSPPYLLLGCSLPCARRLTALELPC